MATGNNSVRSLEHTPTWALAVVCFFFIAISIVLEHCIHLLTNVSNSVETCSFLLLFCLNFLLMGSWCSGLRDIGRLRCAMPWTDSNPVRFRLGILCVGLGFGVGTDWILIFLYCLDSMQS